MVLKKNVNDNKNSRSHNYIIQIILYFICLTIKLLFIIRNTVDCRLSTQIEPKNAYLARIVRTFVQHSGIK